MTTLPIADMDSPSTRETPMTTTNEIADKIASEQGLSKAQSKTIVEAVFASIATAAGSGAETSIPGFGKFKVKDTPEREARNPGTGATIRVAAAKKLTFTPAKALKDALNK
jgi:DNA-binding protein HU-beta